MTSGGSPWATESFNLLDNLWVDLRVLILGPGETGNQEWFGKRINLVEALKELSQEKEEKDEVRTCEELFRLQHGIPIELGYAELTHVDTADLVIALVLGSPNRQGGVYRELEIIAPFPNYRKKVIIVIPNQKSYLQRFQSGVLAVYKEEQKIAMDWNTLRECSLLRQICKGRVEEERKQRMFNKFIARMRARGGE